MLLAYFLCLFEHLVIRSRRDVNKTVYNVFE